MKCNLCEKDNLNVYVDGRTQIGTWAYMCAECYRSCGAGLGIGKGQKYYLVNGVFKKLGLPLLIELFGEKLYISKKEGEFRITFKTPICEENHWDPEDMAYYTDDIEDAYDTASKMTEGVTK